MRKNKSYFKDWNLVSKNILQIIEESKKSNWLNKGQQNSLLYLSKRIPSNGMIIADEVGMGKTRIAVAVSKAVIQAGGRVAVLIPPGLGYQWKEEFRLGQISDIQDPVRSLNGYFRNWPEEGYWNNNVLLISHLFSNWRFSKGSDTWRLSLVPELYARLRKGKRLRLPRNYNELSNERSYQKHTDIAIQICNNTPKVGNSVMTEKMKEITKLTWNDELYNGENYSKAGNSRSALESAVGIGLGQFDLVIIDEAHKGKGEESGLSKLLNNLLIKSKDHRVLGLTATPVELELNNWQNILNRINSNNDFEEILNTYSKSVQKIRNSLCLIDEDRKSFLLASKEFEKSLKPYLIRRGKQEDPGVKLFQERTGKKEYRSELEININPIQINFPESWRSSIFAAEALSFCNQKNSNNISEKKLTATEKRLRLTISNGHGISLWLDSITADANLYKDDLIINEELVNSAENKSSSNYAKQKRADRILHWQHIIKKVVKGRRNLLFQHPAILATIKCIEEEYTSNNEKVLVFGRFTRPMKAFVALLNAREMIRRLDNDVYWPQFQIRNKEEEIVIVEAIKQLNGTLKRKWTIEEVKKGLKKNENKFKRPIKEFRLIFFKILNKEFDARNNKQHTVHESILKKIESKHKKDHHNLFLDLSRACFELIQGVEVLDNRLVDSDKLYSVYIEIINSASDGDIEEDENDEVFDDYLLEDKLNKLAERLKEEYSTQSSRFAKLLNGDILHQSRRIIQMSFNRPKSFPFVLVAQSTVGREGLNLHKACKTVVMLHPEWNPGVAEQQIGRVDRLDSYWHHQVENFIGPIENTPRIEFRPVIFKQTYDEHQWSVLRERWDDLRAQLHGIIIPDRIMEKMDDEQRERLCEINKRAPNFSP